MRILLERRTPPRGPQNQPNCAIEKLAYSRGMGKTSFLQNYEIEL